MTQEAYECFEVHVSERIAHIVMNRPEKRNNMNRAFWDELPQIIEHLDAEAEARVIVISSTGPHFCGGIDVSMFGASDAEAPSTPHAKRQKRTEIPRYGEAHAAQFFGYGRMSSAGFGGHSGRLHWRRY